MVLNVEGSPWATRNTADLSLLVLSSPRGRACGIAILNAWIHTLTFGWVGKNCPTIATAHEVINILIGILFLLPQLIFSRLATCSAPCTIARRSPATPSSTPASDSSSTETSSREDMSQSWRKKKKQFFQHRTTESIVFQLPQQAELHDAHLDVLEPRPGLQGSSHGCAGQRRPTRPPRTERVSSQDRRREFELQRALCGRGAKVSLRRLLHRLLQIS